MSYRLITQQAKSATNPKRVTKSRLFDTWEEAVTAGEALSPDANGLTYPNLEGPVVRRIETSAYMSGLFSGSNRYGAIFHA